MVTRLVCSAAVPAALFRAGKMPALRKCLSLYDAILSRNRTRHCSRVMPLCGLEGKPKEKTQGFEVDDRVRKMMRKAGHVAGQKGTAESRYHKTPPHWSEDRLRPYLLGGVAGIRGPM